MVTTKVTTIQVNTHNLYINSICDLYQLNSVKVANIIKKG